MRCPQCRGEIPDDARKCYHCQADLSSKNFFSRLVGYRDYVAFPTAVIALVVSLYEPIVTTLRRIFFPESNIVGELLHAEPGQGVETADCVKDQEILLRFFLTNTGYALAALQNDFLCVFGSRKKDSLVYLFEFYDPVEKKISFANLDTDQTEDLFARFLGSPLPYTKAYSFMPINSCYISYDDRYSEKHTLLTVRKTKAALVEQLASLPSEDFCDPPETRTN